MLKIKPFLQSTGFCGPASLKMVLEYFGTKKSETELGKLSAAHRYNGTTARNLVLAGKKLGYKGFYKDFSSLKDIKKYLDHRGITQ